MTTATRVVLAILLLLAALCGYLLWHIDWIEREVDTGFTEAAQLEPYLAASLLVQQAGLEAELRQGFALVGSLLTDESPVAADDTLVLLEAWDELDIEQATRLIQWVNDGGTVIFAAQNRLRGDALNGDDFLLQFLTIVLESRPLPDLPAPPSDARERLEQVVAEYAEDRNELLCDVTMELTEFDIGAPRAVMLNFGGNNALDTANPDDLRFGDSRGTQMIVAPRGAGRFIVTTDGRVWDNHHLACWDHAYALLAYSSGKVWFLENRNAQSLLSRIWELSPVGCVLALFVLLLQLQRASRRFGPLLASPALGRRSFLEHIEAGAQLLWDRREGARLVEMLRRDIAGRMQQLDRRFAALDPAAQRELIAHTTRLPLDAIAQALGRPLPARLSRAALRERVSELQRIRALM